MAFAEHIIRYELEGPVILNLRQDCDGDVEVTIGGLGDEWWIYLSDNPEIIEALGFPITKESSIVETKAAKRL